MPRKRVTITTVGGYIRRGRLRLDKVWQVAYIRVDTHVASFLVEGRNPGGGGY